MKDYKDLTKEELMQLTSKAMEIAVKASNHLTVNPKKYYAHATPENDEVEFLVVETCAEVLATMGYETNVTKNELPDNRVYHVLCVWNK